MAHQLRREDLGLLDCAGVQVHGRVEIGAPAAQIWPLIADAAAWTSWFNGMTKAEYTSAAPHGVGSQRTVVVKGLQVTEEVLVFDEQHKFGFLVTGANRPGLAAMVELITLDATAVGTTVTYRQGIDLAPWLRPLSPVVRKALTRAVTDSLAELARRCETAP
jgi:carbon monoxide dehydrogenase subunit G